MKFSKIGFGLIVVGGFTAGVAVYNMNNNKVYTDETKTKPNVTQTVEQKNDKKEVEVKEVADDKDVKKDIAKKVEVRNISTGAAAKKESKEPNKENKVSEKEVVNDNSKKEEVNPEPEKIVNNKQEVEQTEEMNTEELECMYCKRQDDVYGLASKIAYEHVDTMNEESFYGLIDDMGMGTCDKCRQIAKSAFDNCMEYKKTRDESNKMQNN